MRKRVEDGGEGQWFGLQRHRVSIYTASPRIKDPKSTCRAPVKKLLLLLLPLLLLMMMMMMMMMMIVVVVMVVLFDQLLLDLILLEIVKRAPGISAIVILLTKHDFESLKNGRKSLISIFPIAAQFKSQIYKQIYEKLAIPIKFSPRIVAILFVRNARSQVARSYFVTRTAKNS